MEKKKLSQKSSEVVVGENDVGDQKEAVNGNNKRHQKGGKADLE